MKIKSEQQLKEEYLSWLESIKIRRIAYESARFHLKQNEENLKIAKRIFNRTYNDWKIARLECERSKRRWKNQPYKMRKWAKEHMDKVFELFEKQLEKKKDEIKTI